MSFFSKIVENKGIAMAGAAAAALLAVGLYFTSIQSLYRNYQN